MRALLMAAFLQVSAPLISGEWAREPAQTPKARDSEVTSEPP